MEYLINLSSQHKYRDIVKSIVMIHLMWRIDDGKLPLQQAAFEIPVRAVFIGFLISPGLCK
jgi:hypothetical protein